MGLSQIIWGTAQANPVYGASRTSTSPLELNDFRELASGLGSFGISKVDTAPDYGPAEELLGRTDVPKTFRTQTKWKLALGNPREQFKTSQKRLKTRDIWATLVHDSDSLTESPDVQSACEDFSKFLSQEANSRLGFSVYSMEELRAVNAFSLTNGVVQLPYNLLASTLINSEQVKELKSKGFTIQIRSIFMQGMLLANSPLKKATTLPTIERARISLAQVSAETGLSPSGILLFDALNQSLVDEVVVGLSALSETSYFRDFDQNLMSYAEAAQELRFRIRGFQPRQHETDPKQW